MPAGLRILVDQQDPGAGVSGCRGGAQPGGAGTDDDDIGVQVLLVVVTLGCVFVDRPQARGMAQHVLEGGPQQARTVERLVVEAHRQES